MTGDTSTGGLFFTKDAAGPDDAAAGSPAHAPIPALALTAGTAPAGELVTCPECGQVATVDMARRQADDFCSSCDFPLFWARGQVIPAGGEDSGASLRRLPGTVGRAATAALICPHCAEPNPPAGEICIRCSLSLHPVEIPEPEPVIFVPLPPPPAPRPERTFDWWWVVALVTVLIAIAAVVTLISLQ
ncbi:hypothetical protein ACVBEQ_23920 [Nakamurella sp. GG22]